MAAAMRRIAVERKDEFDPRQFLKPAMSALRDLCRARFEAFGTAGQAARLKPMPLAAMARAYASGSLDPIFSVAHAA